MIDTSQRIDSQAHNAWIPDLVREQQAYFDTGATLSYAFRKRQLERMQNALKSYEPALTEALARDLGKSAFESLTTEVGFSRHEVRNTLKQLKRWMRPKRARTPYYLQPARSRIHYTPRGVNLIISPYNFPINLTFAPLIAAIATGNTAVIKTSELTPTCSKVIQSLIEATFQRRYIAYVPGDVPETTELLRQKFAHIFFTGSPRVGAIVMAAAAKHLTPVTLELGGKSPCIIHHDANLEVSARRIVYGKFLNAGQTCVAPDYLLVHQSVKAQLTDLLANRLRQIYGRDPAQSADYGRIVNQHHLERLVGLIDPAKVIVGGQTDIRQRYLAPTLMDEVTLGDRVMQEEVFGPILPILTYSRREQITATIAHLPQHPLALYLFTESRAFQQWVTAHIQFGGGCINHCIQHLANPNLSFGGVGESGMGSYHGFDGFVQFSHKKTLLKAASWLDLPLIYPPYGSKLPLLRRILQ